MTDVLDRRGHWRGWATPTPPPPTARPPGTPGGRPWTSWEKLGHPDAAQIRTRIRDLPAAG